MSEFKPNHLQRFTEKDIEQILKDNLYPKFGERFNKYRDNYLKYLKSEKTNFVTDYPLMVIMELVNRCNLECTMCPQEYRNDIDLVRWDDQALDKIFKQFKANNLESISFSVSEPLLFKNFFEVIKRCHEANIMDIFLFTNGTLLNESTAKKILDSGITRLFISLDAASESTYDKIRIPVGKEQLKKSRLTMLEKQIKNFIHLRDNVYKQQLPIVRTSFVKMQSNEDEVENFIKKWTGIVDAIEIQDEFPISTYEKVNALIESDQPIKYELEEYNCNEPWGQITIYSNGDVTPCCNLLGKKTAIGNVFKDPLKNIWLGEKAKELRDGFIKNKPNKVCKVCSEVYTH
jgi:radical SAM protein with 4Fe4S-binding SPASM domain